MAAELKEKQERDADAERKKNDELIENLKKQIAEEARKRKEAEDNKPTTPNDSDKDNKDPATKPG